MIVENTVYLKSERDWKIKKIFRNCMERLERVLSVWIHGLRTWLLLMRMQKGILGEKQIKIARYIMECWKRTTISSSDHVRRNRREQTDRMKGSTMMEKIIFATGNKNKMIEMLGWSDEGSSRHNNASKDNHEQAWNKWKTRNLAKGEDSYY